MGGVTTCSELSWRARNDDGTEATATWKAAADTAWTQRSNEPFRWRAMLAAGAAGSGASFSCQAQYQLNGGSFTNITTSSSVVKAVASANVTDDEDTTEQMAGAQAFRSDAGGISEDGLLASVIFGPSEDCEVEFVLQIVGADVMNGDEINLRTTKAGVAMDAYGVALDPMITVEKLMGGGNLPLLGAG